MLGFIKANQTKIGYTLCALSIGLLSVSVLKPMIDEAQAESTRQVLQVVLVFMWVHMRMAMHHACSESDRSLDLRSDLPT